MNIAICIPARDTVHTAFTRSLCNLTNRLVKKSINFDVHFVMSSVICDARTQLVEIALQKNHTHILWLDTDMHFPPNVLEKLLAHSKDIVACNYSTRYTPHRPVAFLDKNNIDKRLTEGTGLHKVWAVGMGCMLVDIEIYKKLPPPWFDHIYNKIEKNYSGEDVSFCDYVNNNGYEIYVDSDISSKVAHIGIGIHTLKDVK